MTTSTVHQLAGLPLTTAQQTRLHRAIWAERGHALGISIAVPPCPFDDDTLLSLRAEHRAVSFLPHELSSHLTRDRFRGVFPAMDSYAEAPANDFANVGDDWGWFDYESTHDTPRLGHDEATTIAGLAAAGRTMLTLDQYIVASQDRFLLTGRHLDDRHTWTRLATRYDGRTIAARFDGTDPVRGREDEATSPGALLVAYDLTPDDCGDVLGARSRTSTRDQRSVWHLLWTRTADAYVHAGFPEHVGLDADAYRATLPRVPTQPRGYAGRFDVPLLVEPRIPWREQAQLLDIRLSSHSQRLSFGPADPTACPDVPYIGWFNGWRDRYPQPISPADARAGLVDDERGATAIELIAMDVALPDLGRTARFFEAIGFMVTSPTTDDMDNRQPGRCLAMFRWRGRQELGVNQHPMAYSMFRPLVRGRDVTTADTPTTSEESQ